MKNILRVSLLALFIGVASCEDATNIIQESELSEDLAYQTVDDLRSGLIGVYSTYTPDAGSNGGGDMILFNDLFTDNIKRGESSSGQGNQEYSFVMQPGNGFPTSLWNQRYQVINFANRVLRAWDRIYPGLTDASEIEDANEIKAQLLALRGFMHFELLQYLATDYNDLDAPGVIIMDFVPEDIKAVYPRNTVGEVFEFVNNDLAEAAELMGSTFDSVDEYSNADFNAKYYTNPDVISAMKARVALFEGEYSTAATIANELIASHPLSSGNNLIEMYSQDRLDVGELIWSLSRRQGDNAIVDLWSPNGAGPNGSPFFEVSNGLYNILSNNDVRKLIIIHDGSSFIGLNSPNNILLQGKYLGATSDGAKINDVKIFRSAEMVLIKAEFEARSGDLTAAANTIKSLRDARYFTAQPAPVYANETAALEDVLLERRIEFAFEGHRYLDLKRLGQEIGVGINRNSTDCASFVAPCDLNPGDYRFTLPIPNSEIGANPTIVQNPGY